jgi:HK97 gp10 family phage protein
MSAPGFKVVVGGMKNLKRRMDAAVKEGQKAALDAVVETAYAIQADAVKSIQRGPKSGKSYARGRKSHTASAPGEAPASDTGNLARNIRVKVNRSKGEVAVEANTPYAAALEFGTRGNPSKKQPPMQPRPFMGPAFHKNVKGGPDRLKTKWKQNFKPKE